MKIPIFMYHDVRVDDFDINLSEAKYRPYIQRKSDFIAQMRYLHEQNIETSTIANIDRNDAKINLEVESGKVCITFDDGDVSNYSEVFPVLQEYGQSATLFITTNFVGQPGYVTWHNLKEMLCYGIEIGSHSVSHAIPSKLDNLELYFELSKSKEILEDKLGVSVSSFSLPTGFHHPAVETLAKKAGYKYVANSKFGCHEFDKSSTYDLRRIAIKRGTTFKEFCGYVNLDNSVMYYKSIKEGLKNTLKSILSVDGYNKVRESMIRLNR